MTRFPINEKFLSHQGEGPFSGVLSTFVRFQGCPIKCAWCDTKYTWHPDQVTPSTSMTPAEIRQWVEITSDATNVVITGGEPLVWGLKLDNLVEALCGYTVEIETAGYHNPSQCLLEDPRVFFRVALKLPGADVADEFRNKLIPRFHWWNGLVKTIPGLGKRLVFKWVIANKEDEDFMLRHVVPMVQSTVTAASHWLMPEAQNKERLVDQGQVVQKLALAWGMNFSFRVHLMLHGSVRGV